MDNALQLVRDEREHLVKASRDLARKAKHNSPWRKVGIAERGARVNVGRGERIVSTVLGSLLTVYGLKRRGARGYGMALLGADLLSRGASGHCLLYGATGVSSAPERIAGGVPDVDDTRAIDVRERIEVARPREELFSIWRNFANLPHFMPHLRRVDVLSDTHSHWVTKGPVGVSVEWDAEIVSERENEFIAWQAVEPAEVPNNGTVMFRELANGNTEIFVTIAAEPPAGKVGQLIARLFGASPAKQVRDALERFKEVAESNVHGVMPVGRQSEDQGQTELIDMTVNLSEDASHGDSA